MELCLPCCKAAKHGPEALHSVCTHVVHHQQESIVTITSTNKM